MYVYVYVYTYIYIYMYLYLLIFIYIYLYLYLSVFVCVLAASEGLRRRAGNAPRTPAHALARNAHQTHVTTDHVNDYDYAATVPSMAGAATSPHVRARAVTHMKVT